MEGAAEELGLQLNREKSEVIGHDSAFLEPLSAGCSPRVESNQSRASHLLGSPVGNAESVFRTIQEKTEMFGVTGDRPQHLHAHDVILLTLCTFPCLPAQS